MGRMRTIDDESMKDLYDLVAETGDPVAARMLELTKPALEYAFLGKTQGEVLRVAHLLHLDRPIQARKVELRGEGRCGELLSQLFNDVASFEPQYKVLQYKIDFYCEELNVAVEFDEQHHQTPSRKAKDKIRQKEIEEYLECKFIRIDERKPFEGFNEVLKYVMEHK